jgi:hypothetical protein
LLPTLVGFVKHASAAAIASFTGAIVGWLPGRQTTR